ncbi:cation:proton antiporter [Natranaerobius trueperi]|uniref:Cation/H+ exchanger transmembrane domain-containing protein n=1 Tax=Natranaerobius trueperi TaxID=759412 RepID=A0A226C3M2_9FIRM|nr:cation:proton antiporter [Natranaerobius trueperi]OWZ85027.1 hypothetical protein CDO51_01115 [Natranaerobius trueperi]
MEVFSHLNLAIDSQALGIAVVLLLGLCGGRIIQKFSFPMVVGYIIIGLILGPSVLNIIPEELNNELEVVKVLGLGMIALMIGSELELDKIRGMAKSIFGITIVQFIGAFLSVFLVMYYVMDFSLPVSLLLGALSPATAPASPVAVIREYKANGPLTKAILGVVAVDDALTVVVFGIVVAIVGLMFQGDPLTWYTFLEPFGEVIFSSLLGLLTAILFIIVLNKFLYNQDKYQTLVILIGLALLNSGASSSLGLSPLLTNMVTGFVVANLYENPKVIQRFEEIELPVYIMFFTLTGATLDLEVLANNWVPALILFLTRAVGKVGGAFIGARMYGANKNIQKYLGFAMLSKAGVTIGLLMIIQERFPEVASVLTVLVLANVTLAELTGPLGTRHALVASGEANVISDKESETSA